MKNQDLQFMSQAILMAQVARARGNEPFGAILVKEGQVVMEASNEIVSASDPTHHAEIGIIRRFCQENQISDLSDYTLYSSCEPCCMCAGAMVWSRLGRLVFSVGHDQLAQIAGSNIMLGSQEVFDKSPNRPLVTERLLNDEGLAVFEGYTFG